MRGRRLRRTVAIALLALSAPIFAADSGPGSSAATSAAIRSDARHFGTAIKQSSRQFGHDVARGAREFKVRFNEDMHRAGRAFHSWWEGVKSSTQHASAAMRSRTHAV